VTRRLLISAGEPSGDALAAALVPALRAREPGLELFGMGGPLLREAGADIRVDAPGVSGLVEVARHLPRLFAAQRALVAAARRRRPDAAVLVDFPDFHLRVARALCDLGVPVIQYVGPSVWAWRPRRARAFGRAFRAVLLQFPFEAAAWTTYAPGTEVRVVGHPAADERPRFAQPAAPPWVALAPGSRAHELERHLPVLFEAARRLADRRVVRARWFVAPGIDPAAAASMVADRGLMGVVEVEPAPRGIAPEALTTASAAVVAAGTATLQVALAGVPHVVGYRMHPLSFAVLRRLVRVPAVGLPSLICQREVAPELLQADFHAGAVVRAVEAALDEPDRRVRAQADALALSRGLGPSGASERAAEMILELA